MIWLIIMLILATIVFVLCMSHIELTIDYKRESENDHLTLSVQSLYGLLRFKFDIPTIHLSGLDGVELQTETIDEHNEHDISEKHRQFDFEQIPKKIKQTKQLMHHAIDLIGLLMKTMKRVKCTTLQWYTKIGLTEAHLTAISVGAIWAIKSPLIGLFTSLIDQKSEPHWGVEPVYGIHLFSTEVLCIVKIRVGYAIFAGFMLILRIVKVKGGIQTWKNILFKA